MKMTQREKELASFILKTMKKYVDQKFASLIKESNPVMQKKHISSNSKLQHPIKKKLPNKLASNPKLNEALKQTQGFDGHNKSAPVDRISKSLNIYKRQMDEAYSDFNTDFMFEEDINSSNPKIIEETKSNKTNEYEDIYDSEPAADEFLDASLNDINFLLGGKNMAGFAKNHPSKSNVADENNL